MANCVSELTQAEKLPDISYVILASGSPETDMVTAPDVTSGPDCILTKTLEIWNISSETWENYAEMSSKPAWITNLDE